MTAAARALALLSAVVALGAGRAALSEEQAVTAVWERVPTAEDMAAIMPPPRPCAGMAAGGSALVECRLAEGGGLEQCRIVREAPVGCGYGETALKATRFYRARANLPDGRPIRPGMMVFLPMEFRPAPPEAAPPPALSPVSDRR